jgi:hypothetical protein
MEFFKNQSIKIFLAVTSILLLFITFTLIHSLVVNRYVVECFQQQSSTSHTVNLPLTSKYSCQNFCGPTSRCSITGQQCTADIDCPGCQMQVHSSNKKTKPCIPGDNDAGKLTLGVTPQYSTLTTDIGSQARLFTSNPLKKPPMANFGVDTWGNSFTQSRKLYNSRYKPPTLQNMPSYPDRHSVTGQFMDEGPLPSNSYLTIH